MIIDPPSPFATTKEWEDFLSEMRAMTATTDEDKETVQQMIALAESELATRRFADMG